MRFSIVVPSSCFTQANIYDRYEALKRVVKYFAFQCLQEEERGANNSLRLRRNDHLKEHFGINNRGFFKAYEKATPQ